MSLRFLAGLLAVVAGVASTSTGSVSVATVVSRATGGPAADGSGAPSDCHAITRKSTGVAIAVTLSQYWNAWTSVMDRMPPAITLRTTTAATSAAPAATGEPVTDRSATPAPCICGSRYSHPMPTTSRAEARRTDVDDSLDWAKSGSV